ncbi:MAG: serine--tRNA ligase [Candidatus Woesearchaeota archaeon]
MLDIKLFRENPALIKRSIEKRREFEKLAWVDKVIELDKNYRTLVSKAQELRQRRNELSMQINILKKQGSNVFDLLSEAKEIPKQIKEIESEASAIAEEIKYLQMRIPNILHESVPYGADDCENVTLRVWGTPKKPDFEQKSHGEVIELLKVGDFEKASVVSGAGFYYLIGDLALLEQALQQFAIEILVKKGFKLVQPPLMLRKKPYEGVTDLSDFENVMYKIEGEDLYLIATSEHPIAALMMDETIDEKDLPLKFVGVSPCFRKEIGSHGVDTRGVFRVHHFNKIEQFVFCKPEQSWAFHEELIANAEEIFQRLELPYRIVNICTGDIGIVAAKKYDLEVWMPRENAYKEAVSCSNCTAYQATRLNIKYNTGKGKEYVHTLNSTAIATSRVLRAIIENFQNKDESVNVPKVLWPYMHGVKVIGAKPTKERTRREQTMEQESNKA